MNKEQNFRIRHQNKRNKVFYNNQCHIPVVYKIIDMHRKHSKPLQSIIC